MAVQYWLNKGMRDRTKFLSFRHSYHGDTMGCMSVCDPGEGMHSLFAGLLPPALEHPVLLKIDTQGAELEVLKGLGDRIGEIDVPQPYCVSEAGNSLDQSELPSRS